MSNLVDVEYVQTGKATSTDALGMREMQAMVSHGAESNIFL